MAKPYPTLPLSVLDELNSLNAALDAYHHLTEAWIEQAFRDGCQGIQLASPRALNSCSAR